MKLDTIDRKILTILQSDGRITNAELAKQVGISAPATLERVRRLEKAGVIRKFVALVEPEKVGRGVLAIVMVSLAVHQIPSLDRFRKNIRELEEVLECYHITGEDDFVLKVAVSTIQHYRDFVINKLTRIEGIDKIKTSFILETVKYDTRLAIPDDSESF